MAFLDFCAEPQPNATAKADRQIYDRSFCSTFSQDHPENHTNKRGCLLDKETRFANHRFNRFDRFDAFDYGVSPKSDCAASPDAQVPPGYLTTINTAYDG
ncbi:hypothetical protein LEL_05415 [Akanthomyces lecanii RCEF 1005]|uniref:Uncharacterized protein n=1 Tax=Akanthomyces lecanii RCEF 1005 TaxID=1081108 RepID=A0A162K6J0_CORDF|nr:hypothetical protein LEL_05415 [Akanthomyces lecanii RCEF 1005]